MEAGNYAREAVTNRDGHDEEEKQPIWHENEYCSEREPATTPDGYDEEEYRFIERVWDEYALEQYRFDFSGCYMIRKWTGEHVWDRILAAETERWWDRTGGENRAL